MTETVPGMAEAIRRRSEQRGLSPSRFAEAAGLTEPGLKPVRDGIRKQYALKTRRGVAVALAWPLDWYERIEAGQDPEGFPEVEHTASPVSQADRLAQLEREVAGLRSELETALRELRADP